jgi:hypothetical protein
MRNCREVVELRIHSPRLDAEKAHAKVAFVMSAAFRGEIPMSLLELDFNVNCPVTKPGEDAQVVRSSLQEPSGFIGNTELGMKL